ncbi:hypothetical protein [Bradyrhizobium elkanii]|uniref:hypothetical protein n=1 Tax=Bradyrhizobium elkanii TaxID=29448 RepID=UPI0004019F4A|nr:hypothetical protein [Bradyrhizobium elkanii]
MPIFREEKFAAQLALQRGNFCRFLTIDWIVSPVGALATAFVERRLLPSSLAANILVF